MSRPLDNDYRTFAAQLGITRSQATRLGKHECRRLLSMDESARALVMTTQKSLAAQAPDKRVEAMMLLAEKRRARCGVSDQ